MMGRRPEQRVVRHVGHEGAGVGHRRAVDDGVHEGPRVEARQEVDALRQEHRRAFDGVDRRAQLEAAEAVERVGAREEALADDEARQRRLLDELPVAEVGLPRVLQEEHRRLLEARVVLEAPRQRGVAQEHLRLVDAAVDGRRDGQARVADHVAEHDGRAAEHAAPEVVLRVAHVGPRHVLGPQRAAVALVRERALVRQGQLGASPAAPAATGC
jgi:hypothetical protein